MSVAVQKQTQHHSEEFQNGHAANGQQRNGHATSQSWHAPHDGKQVTEEEYWKLYYEKGHVEGDASYEWNNGILEAKPMASQRQARLYNWFLELLSHFLKVHPVALLMNLEIGFRMELDDPKGFGGKKISNRKPDIGIIHQNNPVPWLDEERSYKGICDMIIESVSDSDQGEIERDTIIKKAEYEAAGVREYFILDPSEENQYFYRLNESNQYMEIVPEDDVIHSVVLPGFQFRLRDFARQPSLEEMAQDEVYQDFVLPAYQAALKATADANARAAEERLRAQEATARAAEAADRIARLEARLRAAGVDVSEIN